MPAHPWKSYRHRGVKIESDRKKWDAKRVYPSDTEGDLYGLAGVFVQSNAKGAWGRVTSKARNGVGAKVSQFELFYLTQPGGGSFKVFLDGKFQRKIASASESMQAAYAEFKGHR